MLLPTAWILTGAVLGFFVSVIEPRRRAIGRNLAVFVGVVGALLGGVTSALIWHVQLDSADRLMESGLVAAAGSALALSGAVAAFGGRLARRRF